MEMSRGRTKSAPLFVAAALVLAVGVVFVASTFANNLFEVGPAFEEMIDDFRPLLQDEALATAESDLGALAAVSDEFGTAVVPQMSEALGMAPEDFQAFLGEQFPAVATGAAALREIGTQFSGLVASLADQQDLFKSADEIPTADLPATTVPWGILLAGVAALAVGAVMLWKRRVGMWLAIVLGAALVVVPIVLSLVPKAADADELNDNLEPIYTAETIAGASGAYATVGAMAAEMETMLPALGEQLGIPPADLPGFLAGNFPALGAVVDGMPVMLERFDTFVATFDVNLDNYETLQPVQFLPIIWTIIVGGMVILVAGGMALAFGRRGAPVSDVSVPDAASVRERVKAG